MDIVTKLTREKKVPTEADLKRAIKREGARWRPELGALLLIKHEARPTTQTSVAFCKRVGLKDTNRISYWRVALDWDKKKEGIMKALKKDGTPKRKVPGTVIEGSGSFEKVMGDAINKQAAAAVEQLPAFQAEPAQPMPETNHYISVRYRIEEMASQIKAIGEKYPDLKDHTSAIRKEMGKFVHFTIDREFTDTVPVVIKKVEEVETKSVLNGGAKHTPVHPQSS